MPARLSMGPRGAMATKRTILIVDDDAELRDALVEQLALHEEFDAISADSGTKGVQAAKNGQVDLVIMDVGLPDVDGREAVRILRKNGFKAPFIMLPGHDTDSDTILGLESAANDSITNRSALPFCLHVYARSFDSMRQVRMLSSQLVHTHSGQARNCCSARRAAKYASLKRKRRFCDIFFASGRKRFRERTCVMV